MPNGTECRLGLHAQALTDCKGIPILGLDVWEVSASCTRLLVAFCFNNFC
jgi:hypothetical protein